MSTEEQTFVFHEKSVHDISVLKSVVCNLGCQLVVTTSHCHDITAEEEYQSGYHPSLFTITIFHKKSSPYVLTDIHM